MKLKANCICMLRCPPEYRPV